MGLENYSSPYLDLSNLFNQFTYDILEFDRKNAIYLSLIELSYLMGAY